MSKKEIVVVEDEAKIAELLKDYLSAADYDVTILDEGTRATDTIRNQQPDCVILDLMLPGKDGLQICKEVRQFSDVPIVMITARVDEIDRLLGLELGADDYICKPFSPREVVVRVRNILRRVALTQTVRNGDPESKRLIAYPPLQLDPEKFRCLVDAVNVDLTVVEFRMLAALAERPGSIFSRNQLMDHAYTDGRVVSDRTIDTHIKNIRRKLTGATDQELVHSIYGLGYKVE
ncbi:MAG: response regulator [Pseudomonadota bacterium]